MKRKGNDGTVLVLVVEDGFDENEEAVEEEQAGWDRDI